jgi:protein-S-isoprenylcysteine O-methyltransferase Ste14
MGNAERLGGDSANRLPVHRRREWSFVHLQAGSRDKGSSMLIVRGLIAGLLQVTIISSFLLVPAGLVPGGTWCWKHGLLFICIYGFFMQSAVVTLAILAPASLEARLRKPASKTQPLADRVITALIMVTFFGWFIFIPVDVFYLKLFSKPPFLLSVCGGMLSLLGYVIIMTAIYQNSFATPIVEDQSERGQSLVDRGLYGVVRHPFYLGMMPFMAGIALWLESYASLLAVSVLLMVLIARILVEERTLQKTLPGYPEYLKKVRYRLVPFIW